MGLKCKFCGKDAQASSTGVRAGSTQTCVASPTKKHVLVPDGEHCVFCGLEVDGSSTSGLRAGSTATCVASPSRKHLLDD
jgi:hypothetical protein